MSHCWLSPITASAVFLFKTTEVVVGEIIESVTASVLEAGCETVETGAASEEVVTTTVVSLVDTDNGLTLASETFASEELHPAKMSITITATPIIRYWDENFILLTMLLLTMLKILYSSMLHAGASCRFKDFTVPNSRRNSPAAPVCGILPTRSSR